MGFFNKHPTLLDGCSKRGTPYSNSEVGLM